MGVGLDEEDEVEAGEDEEEDKEIEGAVVAYVNMYDG